MQEVCYIVILASSKPAGHVGQCLSQDLETGCLKLAVVKFWGVQIFKGDQNKALYH